MQKVKTEKETDPKNSCPMKDKVNKRCIHSKITMTVETARKCLKLQRILREAPSEVIEDLLGKGEIVKFRKGQRITTQGDAGESSFFILRGVLDVLVNGRKVAERYAEECVGEMSVLDPTQNRCATLMAAEEVHLLWIKSDVMEQLLNENIAIMRQVARELCARLRERSKHYECPNNILKIFVGSSSEGLTVAKRVSDKIKTKELDVNLWNKNVFNPSENNIEALVEQAKRCDFAILVLTPDDWVRSRGKLDIAPRDNVIFELGLFMGAIGRNRTFLLTTTDTMKLPSDLDGITRVCCTVRKDGAILIADAVRRITNEIISKGAK